MKKLLMASLMALALIAVTGCNDATASNSDEKTMKCGEGKCGGDKKAEKTTKCGGDKKCSGEKKDEKTAKCGEGKCGSSK